MLNSARQLLAGIALTSLLAAGFSSPAFAAPTEVAAGEVKARPTASAAFKARHGAVVDLVKKRAEQDLLSKEVDQLLDYKALAEASLGGPARYAGKCGERCTEFEGLLAKLIRENYLKRIRTDKKYELTIVGEETKLGGDVHVITNIALTREGKPEVVEVVYVMHLVGETWKVQDIITDGVSLAKNYKFEFNKIIREQGFDELMARLDKKLGELASKG